jgi:hypothetical protein
LTAFGGGKRRLNANYLLQLNNHHTPHPAAGELLRYAVE